MIRRLALAAASLCLAGCFVFDNPFDTSSPPPTLLFQIVVHGGLYPGTYIWTAADNAYEALVGGTSYYIYMDGVGMWTLASQKNQVDSSVYRLVNGNSPPYRGLPPTSGLNWTPADRLSGIDGNVGGIGAQSSPLDNPISQAQVLQAGFLASSAGNGALYQWETGSPPSSFAAVSGETNSTFLVKAGNLSTWIRVVITPTDSTGVVLGPPVASPPVYVSN